MDMDSSDLDINGSTLNQFKALMSRLGIKGLGCVDGCANAGVLSTLTHVITHTVAHCKANLHGAESGFKSHGLSIGTGVTALVHLTQPSQFASLSTEKLASMMTQLHFAPATK